MSFDTSVRWYEKRPVRVQAYQTDKEMDIDTLEGTMHASVGDYVITGVKGEKYPCKPDIFEMTYKEVKPKSEDMDRWEASAELMLSDDYKERFRAEYWQTKIRYNKLHNMVVRYEAGNLDFDPKSTLELLKSQKSAMGQYLYALEVRSVVEGIDLR